MDAVCGAQQMCTKRKLSNGGSSDGKSSCEPESLPSANTLTVDPSRGTTSNVESRTCARSVECFGECERCARRPPGAGYSRANFAESALMEALSDDDSESPGLHSYFRAKKPGEEEAQWARFSERQAQQQELKRKMRRGRKGMRVQNEALNALCFLVFNKKRKAVPVCLSDREISDDLAVMRGKTPQDNEYGQFDEDLRQDLLNTNSKRRRATKKDVPLQKARRVDESVAAPHPNGTGAGRSAKASGKGAGNGDNLVKHMHRKGWLKCTLCDEDVWPPNRAKHAAHCVGLMVEDLVRGQKQSKRARIS